jgi:succinate dehydrogenase / fumarate reductase, iron-sulfur subunit
MIKRQASPQSSPYWEEFDLHSRPGMNAIVGLMDIAANPVDRLGNPTTPVNYESNCLEEVCVSCAMLINGKAAMACSSLKTSWNSRSAWNLCPAFRSFATLRLIEACF